MIKVVCTNEPMYARSMSFFTWKRVYIGTSFATLSLDEQVAALSHEEGHCELHHTEVRILFLALLPWFFIPLCKYQELAADRYAASKGHSDILIRMFERWKSKGGWLHPSDHARKHNLKKHDLSRLAPVKGTLANWRNH